MNSLLHDLRRLAPSRPLRFAEAIRVAELQASRLLAAQSLTEPPVPSEIVWDFPRVQIETIRPLGVSGATLWSNGRWQIVLNADEPKVRQRFSAAHELKHVIDHPRAELFYPPAGGVTTGERQEQIADYFAACLLMPRMWVKRAYRSGIQDATSLAALFDVSREAMNYRLISLGLTERRVRCEVA